MCKNIKYRNLFKSRKIKRGLQKSHSAIILGVRFKMHTGNSNTRMFYGWWCMTEKSKWIAREWIIKNSVSDFCWFTVKIAAERHSSKVWLMIVGQQFPINCCMQFSTLTPKNTFKCRREKEKELSHIPMCYCIIC